MKPKDWEWYLIKVGIFADSAKIHDAKFTGVKLTRESLQMLDRWMLKELGVTLIEVLCILNQAKEVAFQTTYTKAPVDKLPQLNLEIIPRQFRRIPN